MSSNKNIKMFTNKEEALAYIDEIFPVRQGPIDKRRPDFKRIVMTNKFVSDFKSLVRTAKKLKSLEKQGKLYKNSDINKELKKAIKETNRYMTFLSSLNNVTQRLVNDAYIQDDHRHGITSTCFEYLIDDLDKIIGYCKHSELEGKREPSEFKKLEFYLARAYEDTGRKIVISSDGEFGNVLRAFHLCCKKTSNPDGIDYAYAKRSRDGIDDAYIKEIKDKMRQYT